jgi:hypothetical protein
MTIPKDPFPKSSWLKRPCTPVLVRYGSKRKTFFVRNQNNVKINPYLFLSYQLLLTKRLGSIRGSEEKIEQKRRRATFKIILQLTMATRCVMFGKESTGELLHYLVKNNKVSDFIKEN